MKQRNVLYLVVLGAASFLVMGCGGSTGGSGTTKPTPTTTVSVAVGKTAMLGENGTSKVSFASNITVTNSGGSDTAYTCASSSANLATVNDASACTFTFPATGSGDATITVTAHADSTKTATFVIHVGNFILTESSTYGLQITDMGASTPKPLTILSDNKPLTYVAWFPDHNKIAGLDYNSNNHKINVYQTDGTAAGTALAYTIDLSTWIGTRGINYLAVSPDGAKLAFTVEEGANIEGIYTVSSAAVASGSTATPTLLYTEPANGSVAVSGLWFTPDGKKIIIENVATKTVYTLNIDGTNFTQLISVPATVAMYSPDASTLYYANYSNGWTTYVKDVATGTIQKTLPGYLVCAASPNGKSILLTDMTNMYIADASGANLSSSSTAVGVRGAW